MAKRTPLYAQHVAAGARMIDFAGWQMPVQYAGVLQEHRAVRTAAGLFDLSHMGEFYFSGAQSVPALQRLTTNDVSALQIGQAQYSMMCRPDGGIVDDILLYRLAEEEYMMVVNAANIDKDAAWVQEHLPAGCAFVDRSDQTALIAVQGPQAAGIVQSLTTTALDELYSFEACRAKVAGHEALVSRTGYTGEDGFELYIQNAAAPALWEALLSAGGGVGLVPVGLGACDTLRLEARLTLYGNDIDESTSPIEAGLGFFVRPEKGDFLGRDVLAEQKKAGVGRKLVAFVVQERGIPRHGYPLLSPSGAPIGQATSGSFSPSLEKDIGMGYVTTEYAVPGGLIAVDVRGKARPAQLIKGRFVPTTARRRP